MAQLTVVNSLAEQRTDPWKTLELIVPKEIKISLAGYVEREKIGLALYAEIEKQ